MSDYGTHHDVGDKLSIPAPDHDHADASGAHEVELYHPPGSHGNGLKWKCDSCKYIFADPVLFESKPCISFGVCR